VTAQPWDAALLSRIAHLHLRARRAVAGWQQGSHRSQHQNTNIEFADYKEYAPGDPIKHLDWRVAARSDRLVIRRQQAETEVSVTLIVDASGDIGTGVPDLDRSKMGAGIVAAATFATFLHRRGDPVGLEILGGDGCSHPSISARRTSLAPIMRTLAEVTPAGRADLADAFERIGPRLPRRSVAILISDLMEEPSQWAPSVHALCQRGVDVRVLHLYDPIEWNVEFKESMRLFSPEGGDDLAIDPKVVREQMGQVISDYLDEIKAALSHGRASHFLHGADAGLDSAMRAILRGRS